MAHWANCEKWTDICLQQLIQDHQVPDFWDANHAVTFGLLRRITDAIETSGSLNNLSTLRQVLTLLKPELRLDGMPNRYSHVKRKLLSKSLQAANTVPWTVEENGQPSLGPIAASLMLTPEHLEQDDMPMPPLPSVTCGLILELRRYWYQHSYTWKVFARWLHRLTAGKINLNQSDTRRKVNGVHTEHITLLKRASKVAVDDLLARDFTGAIRQPDCDELDDGGDDTVLLADYDMQTERLATIDASVQTLCNEIPPITDTASEWRRKYGELKREYETCTAELKAMRASFNREKRNSARREQRRDNQLIEQKSSLLRQQSELKAAKEQLQQVSQEKRSLVKQRYYYQQRALQLQHDAEEHKVELEVQTGEVREIATANKHLEEEVHSILAEKLEIPTLCEGRYSDAIRQTVMGLGSVGVSAANISKVISLVADSLFSVSFQRLPSEATVKQLLTEANIVGKLQLCDRLMNADNATLHVDGTTDHQRHFFGYQVGTGADHMAMSVRETVSSDSATQLQQLQSTVEELASLVACGTEERDRLSTQMLLAVKNLMTDQAAVNKKFKDDFESLRLSLISRSECAWSSLSADEKSKLVSLNQWFCFLHVLLGFADSTERALKDYEEILTSSGSHPIGRNKSLPDNRRDSSATLECVKAVASLLTPSGHPAAGLPEDFRAFLAARQRKVRLVKFAHTRFNVVYLNASAVWHHRQDIADFLASGHENQLIAAVKGDVSDPSLLACVRAVAFFHVHITSPFHRLILSEHHILDLNPKLEKLLRCLETLSQDPWQLLSSDYEAWCGPTLTEKEGWMLEALPSSKDEHTLDITMEVFSLLATHGLVTFSRQVASQLPGGEHGADTVELRSQSVSVATSNSIGESQFALLKHLRQRRPNANLENIEGSILWAYNKTLPWLQRLTPERREAVLQTAREKTGEFKQLWKGRRETLLAQRNADRYTRQATTEAKAAKVVSGRQKAVEEVASGGGQCRTEEDVDALVGDHATEKERLIALKAQLRFYKTVLKCPRVEKNLYNFSHKGVNFPSYKLAANLKLIITQYNAYLADKPSTAGPSHAPPPEIRQEQIEKIKKSVLCQYKAPNASKSAKRPGDFPDPVGKRVRHRWKTGKRHRWYKGKVVGLCDDGEEPSFSDDADDNDALSSMYRLYRVVYDGEEAEYKLRAEKDWYRGDLEFEDW